MRIIGGIHKRRIIHPPKNLPVRPTTDRAKESLFNILNNLLEFEDVSALDLFAGTGNISYELASRNCKLVTSVDRDYGCIRFISKVKSDLGMGNLKPIKQDVFRFVGSTKIAYDFIFADPPYALNSLIEIPKLILNNNLLKPDGILVIEHPDSIDFTNSPGFFDHRYYSRVNFSFFRNTVNSE